jgi:hypothetical protein
MGRLQVTGAAFRQDKAGRQGAVRQAGGGWDGGGWSWELRRGGQGWPARPGRQAGKLHHPRTTALHAPPMAHPSTPLGEGTPPAAPAIPHPLHL